MSTPPGHKELWKNMTWQNEEEKLAFFNHYFRDSSIVSSYVAYRMKSFKERLIAFIQKGIIVEGKEERKIINQDIINEIMHG